MRFLGLRRVVNLYSFKNTVVRDVIEYYSNDNIIREVNTFNSYHNYPIELFYIGCLAMTIILVILNTQGDTEAIKIQKMQRIQRLQDRNMMRCINVFLIIFTVIFTKDIENAI